MRTNRREFLANFSLGLGAAALAPSMTSWARAADASENFVYPSGGYAKIDSAKRRFHLSVTTPEVLADERTEQGYPMPANPDAVELNATRMIDLWKEAGVTDIWLNPYIYGLFPDLPDVDKAARRALDAGLEVHFITVPIGHPNAKFAPEIAARWEKCERFNGTVNTGVSCHKEVAKDCVASIRKIADHFGPCDVFLDDDFRFATTPDDIGGCVCPECKAGFMRAAGVSDARWNELIDSLKSNTDTKLVRTWIDYFCDRMTRVFRASQDVAPEVDLGVMVMGMGSEKAGIRLDDYRGALLRVGEWMFTNEQYDVAKNKTIELYSSLFHRRFAAPGRAFSETTIIQELSAENYVSKLSVSTLSDVRNTMFMCPIPASYWGLIAPRMERERARHDRIVGAPARGPFKHFWGLADRYMASHNAYSLFLACGVPFEVCDELPSDGWAFLGDASAREMERGELTSPGAKCVARFESEAGRFEKVPETFEELFKFRKPLLDGFRSAGIPYVEEETPVVLGWYPDVRAFYLWNIEKTPKVVRVRKGEQTVAVELKALDSALVVEESDGAFRII